VRQAIGNLAGTCAQFHDLLKWRFMRHLTTLILAALLALSPAANASACGFENAAGMQKGMLNWIYPKSLYVDTAVWQAQQAGLLPHEEALPAQKSLLVNPGYRRAVRTIQDYAGAIGAGTGGKTGTVTLMLLEAIFYARISFGPAGAHVQPHIAAPDNGEPLFVTHRVVIEAIRTGRIGLDDALSMGVIRTYGDPARIDEVLANLRLAGNAGVSSVAAISMSGLRR
jgi:hypothetical protein